MLKICQVRCILQVLKYPLQFGLRLQEGIRRRSSAINFSMRHTCECFHFPFVTGHISMHPHFRN